MGKNLKDLQTSIDSMGVRLDSIKDVNAKSIYDASYVKTLKSLRAKKESEAEGQPDEQQEKLPVITPTIQLDFDSLYQAQAPSSKAAFIRPGQILDREYQDRLLFPCGHGWRRGL